MTHQIWTRIVIATLILMGDSALASKISHRSDAEAIASGNTVQVSQSESPDDSDTKWQPVLTDASFIQNKVNLKFQALTTLIHLNAYSSEHNLYNSRAPPASF